LRQPDEPDDPEEPDELELKPDEPEEPDDPEEEPDDPEELEEPGSGAASFFGAPASWRGGRVPPGSPPGGFALGSGRFEQGRQSPNDWPSEAHFLDPSLLSSQRQKTFAPGVQRRSGAAPLCAEQAIATAASRPSAQARSNFITRGSARCRPSTYLAIAGARARFVVARKRDPPTPPGETAIPRARGFAPGEKKRTKRRKATRSP
jgi:hypothetical protein